MINTGNFFIIEFQGAKHGHKQYLPCIWQIYDGVHLYFRRPCGLCCELVLKVLNRCGQQIMQFQILKLLINVVVNVYLLINILRSMNTVGDIYKSLGLV